MAINSLNTMVRLTGLSSGMDTDSIIQNLMKVQQLKLNRDLRAKTKLQWRQEALKSVSADLKNFRNTYMSVLSKDNMLTASAYTVYNVSKRFDTNDAVTISANSDAFANSVTINSVKSLASATKVESNQKVSNPEYGQLGGSNDVSLADLNATGMFGTAIQFATREIRDVNGDPVMVPKVDEEGNVVMQQAIDPETGELLTKEVWVQEVDDEGNPVTEWVENAEGEMVEQPKMISTQEPVMETVMVPATEQYVSFSINGEDFDFTSDTTLQQMINEVNSSNAGVTMIYSRLSDTFALQTKTTGFTTSIRIENSAGNMFGSGGDDFGVLGIKANSGDNQQTYIPGQAGAEDYAYSNGTNANVVINGISVSRDTNSFTIDGIKYALNDIFNENYVAGDGSRGIEVSLTKNVDAAVDKIKTFIDGYNALVQKLNNLLDEPRDSAYYPLTDDEKAALSEKEVENWESAAKSGILRNDDDIRRVLDNLRGAFYTAVSGTGMSPADIGLQTGSWESRGEIVIDENKLRAALEKDSDAVMRAFTNNGDSFEEKGLLYRMTSIMDNYTKETQYYTLEDISQNLRDISDKISAFEERMLELEERYYKKFSAMETALSKLNSQSSWISSMLGSSS